MKPSETYDLLSEKEHERWLARRMRRNLIIGHCIMAVLVLIGVAGIAEILYVTIALFVEFSGPSAWPSGLFMELLLIYSLWVTYRYVAQRDKRDDEYDD